jgi:hypothetical protein
LAYYLTVGFSCRRYVSNNVCQMTVACPLFC